MPTQKGEPVVYKNLYKAEFLEKLGSASAVT
jgi:hypothetical protein